MASYFVWIFRHNQPDGLACALPATCTRKCFFRRGNNVLYALPMIISIFILNMPYINRLKITRMLQTRLLPVTLHTITGLCCRMRSALCMILYLVLFYFRCTCIHLMLDMHEMDACDYLRYCLGLCCLGLDGFLHRNLSTSLLKTRTPPWTTYIVCQSELTGTQV